MQRIYALYVRVSTEEQAKTGLSLETQKEKLLAYAKFMGWKNIEIFSDDGKSAKDMNRPALIELIKKIELGQVAAVVTIAIDRLSRNLLDMLQFIKMCEEHNTAYICTALNFDTSTPIGKMVLQILAAFAEFERSMIQSRVTETMLKAANDKKYMATPPFGYKLVNGKLIVVPEEAEWVKKAADMFIAGHGYRAVAKWLNDAGIKTKKGVDWTSSTVRGMLTNELYIGTVIWNRRYYDSKGKLCWRDESEWIVNENVHEPILSKEQWNEINNRIKRKMPKGGQKQYKYRLSGILKCGYCGSAMTSRRYGSKGPHKERFIFVCSNYQKKGGCKFNYIFVNEADAEVYSILEQITVGLMDVPVTSLHSLAKIQEEDYERQLKMIDLKFQRQIEAYENGIISANDLRIARERVDKERRNIIERRKKAKKLDHNDFLESIQNEAKQLLWIWEQGDLAIIHNSLRTIFEGIIVEDKKVKNYLLSRDLFKI